MKGLLSSGSPALLLALTAALLAGCSTAPAPAGYDPAQKAADYSQNQGQAGGGQVQDAPFWSTDGKQKTLTNQPPLENLNPAAPVPAPAPAP